MDETKIDLDAPAFGEGAQTVKDLEKQEEQSTTAEASEEESAEGVKESDKVKEEEKSEDSDEDKKVPYSRFKKFHEAAKENERLAAEATARAEQAERDAREYRERFEALKPKTDSKELPQYWINLFGDSEESKLAYASELERQEVLRREAKEEAVKAIREEREQESKRERENLAVIDRGLEDLSDTLGRDLTKKEQESLLDIVDEYTSKDKEGNYVGPLLSFEKAWEIYELKEKVSKAPKKQSRDAVAALSGTQSQGEPSVDSSKDKDFNPAQWPTNWDGFIKGK